MTETNKEEKLKKYKDELKKYLKWRTGYEGYYATFHKISPAIITPIRHFSKEHYGEFRLWSRCLREMRETLGITDEENKRIITEVKRR